LILLFSQSKKVSACIFLWSLIAACGFGLWSALSVLCQKWILLPSTGVDFRVQGHLPLGEFYIGIDALSAFFLLLLFIVSLAAGIYGFGYLRDYEGKRNAGVHLALYHLLIIVMALVLVAKNAVLFLAAWELMTVVSYFLITFYNESEGVRKAGFIYLIAAHLGVFCLAIMFLVMGSYSGSLNFDQITATQFPLGLAALLFMLAFVGFGIKAGFIPFHIWLPRAHPAAPSYISAILSGVVIKIGIYGLMRVITLVKDFPLWCALFLLIMAAISGIGGVLYALGQHEIKKLLAYHSIENIGIIALGLGIGMIGHAYHQETVAFLGYTAALLHTFNHAIFKGLLFLSAGSVIHSTHTGDMERMGGLFKLLPWTGHLFLIGSLSICGLPLFNGFISEWLVFRALLEGVLHLDIFGIIFSTLGVIALALIGGLAALCFAKAFGVIFLGKNRTGEEHYYKEGDLIIRGPMILLAVICLWAGLFPVNMVYYAFQGAQAITGLAVPYVFKAAIIDPLLSATRVLLFGGIIFAALALLRKFCNLLSYVIPNVSTVIPAKAGIQLTETWACAYTKVTPRMQYTASSFAKPMLKIFRSILFFKVDTVRPKGYFPTETKLSSSVKDASQDLFFRPLFYVIKKSSRKLKWIQSGHTQTYILYILFLLVILLIWKLH
jgi:formate hydrogenlyase subunit 3/multisubunit Na+/H+ antiporter MnhD subunit